MKRLCTIVLLVSFALLPLCYGRPLTILGSLHEPDRNGTHSPALQKRMDPSHDNQRDAQIYKDAERNGARLLVMLLAEGADLARLQASGMAEPMRPPSKVSTQVTEEPMNANQVNQNIAGYEDVMRAKFQDWDPQQFPKAVVQFQAVKIAYRAESTEAIFGARNHGILRTTNLRQAPGQLHPDDESPLRDLKDAAWTQQEGYKIVGRWMTLTSKDVGFRNDGFARNPRPLPPEYAGMNKFHAITGSRRMLQFVTDPCIANDVVSRLIRAVLSNNQRSQDLRQLPTVASPFVLQITDKNAWAILGAPGHRWFFGLLYNWRDILAHKVPTAVRIYRNNAATQVGMTWILEDYDAQKHDALRARLELDLASPTAGSAGPPASGGSTTAAGNAQGHAQSGPGSQGGQQSGYSANPAALAQPGGGPSQPYSYYSQKADYSHTLEDQYSDPTLSTAWNPLGALDERPGGDPHADFYAEQRAAGNSMVGGPGLAAYDDSIDFGTPEPEPQPKRTKLTPQQRGREIPEAKARKEAEAKAKDKGQDSSKKPGPRGGQGGYS